MIIPYQDLSDDALAGIIESFILREGTDYGLHEKSMDDKIKELKAQLISGKAVLVYSELYETVNIMERSQFNE